MVRPCPSLLYTKHAGLFLPFHLSNAEQVTALQHYAAPEQTDTSLDALATSASAATDVFALGLLTYTMIVGKDAFPARQDGLGRRWQARFLLQLLTSTTKH